MSSITFNSIDLSTYNLSLKKSSLPWQFSADSVLIQNKSYSSESRQPPRTISFDITVTGATSATLKTNLDAIKAALNTTSDKQLILSTLSDRYWNARFSSFSGEFKSPTVFSGSLDFTCVDPFAYGTSEVSNTYTDNENPETITETAGGTALIEPVYTFTSSVLDATASIRIRNETTDMEMTWGPGAIGIGGVLIIDCSTWIVTLNGTASMLLLSTAHEFPLLSPGANTIKVYGFTGTVNITYRNRYA
jgi:predicted phage tail component-like protein